MAKNDIFLIDGIIDERVNMAFPSSDRGEVFELFSVEQIFKDYVLSTEDLLNCCVDGQNDGGIDFIFIFLNGNLVQSIEDISIPKRNALLEVYFVTCKHSDSFKMATLDAMLPTFSELLDFSKTNFDGAYNELILDKRNTLYEIYKKTAAVLSGLKISVKYACRGEENNEISGEIVARGAQIKSLIEGFFSGSIVDIDFVGRGTLLSLYRNRPKLDLNLRLFKTFSSDNCYVGLASIHDFYDLITDENGKLRYYLFDSNVRDYMGKNRVNGDILDTLENKKHIDFWLLNNGITILVEGAVAVGDIINLTNIQIINGLQTSYAIYYYLSAHNSDNTDRKVLIRIIESKDSEIRDNIIRATNNQTSIGVSSLHATDKIQRDIENILHQHNLYYERKQNYYSNLGVSKEDIITPIELAKTYASLILKLPQRAVSLKTKFMDIPEEYAAVFNPDTDLNVWPQLVLLSRSITKFLHEVRGEFDKQTKFYSFVKPLTLFMAVSLFFKNYSFGVKDILKANVNIIEEQCFQITWEFLSHQIIPENIKLLASKAFIIPICEKFAQEYNIIGLDIVKHAKNVLLYDKIFDLDDTFINSVKALIPLNTKKPNSELKWKISKELMCDPQKVVQAFAVIFHLTN